MLLQAQGSRLGQSPLFGRRVRRGRNGGVVKSKFCVEAFLQSIADGASRKRSIRACESPVRRELPRDHRVLPRTKQHQIGSGCRDSPAQATWSLAQSGGGTRPRGRDAARSLAGNRPTGNEQKRLKCRSCTESAPSRAMAAAHVFRGICFTLAFLTASALHAPPTLPASRCAPFCMKSNSHLACHRRGLTERRPPLNTRSPTMRLRGGAPPPPVSKNPWNNIQYDPTRALKVPIALAPDPLTSNQNKSTPLQMTLRIQL